MPRLSAVGISGLQAGEDVKSGLKRLGSIALWSGLFLAVAATVVLLLARFDMELVTTAERLEAASPVLALWRLALVAGLIALWGPLIRTLARRRGLTDQTRIEAATATRWPLAILLLSVELVLVQDLFGQLARLLP